MRLADETIILRTEGEVIMLRPTLRAAIRLDRQFGGFGPILKGVLEGSLTVMAALVREGASGHTRFPDYLLSLEDRPLRAGIEPIRLALLRFACSLSGVDWENPEPAAEGGKSAGDYYTRLFEIGTGWLGWTADQTWDTTPAEILSAYRGRFAMLNAIYGNGDAKSEAVEEKDAMTVLRSMVAAGENKGSG